MASVNGTPAGTGRYSSRRASVEPRMIGASIPRSLKRISRSCRVSALSRLIAWVSGLSAARAKAGMSASRLTPQARALSAPVWRATEDFIQADLEQVRGGERVTKR
ncbi:hypothetical protein D3C85_1253400 [compost metagenome]